MQKRQLLVNLDERTIETLRAMAIRRGMVCLRGPGAPLGRGNVTQLLTTLAEEWLSSPRKKVEERIS